MSGAYYNEHDPKAAAWLRELIKRDLIAPGEVDERSIVAVRPDDLRGFTQAHFFAGIGTWSAALRRAGWEDSRPCWTGSPPCQPFSTAGKQLGADDERHLAPVFMRLVAECRPPVLFGEQVASAASGSHGWWADALRAELEAQGYAFGMAVLGAHSVGAPHIRQRLWFVAHAADSERWSGERGAQAGAGTHGERGRGLASGGRADGVVADGEQQGRQGLHRPGVLELHGAAEQLRPAREDGNPLRGFWADAVWLPCRDGRWRPTGPGIGPLVRKLADAVPARRSERWPEPGYGPTSGGCGACPEDDDVKRLCWEESPGCGRIPQPRPLEVADGSASGVGRGGDCGAPGAQGEEDADNTAEARVMRLRGYGNGICLPLSQLWIEVCMEAIA